MTRRTGRWSPGQLLSLAVYTAACGASVAMRAALPPIPLYGTMHDDLLQVRLADRILSGEWLGDWEVLILLKGPGYPLFLAGSNLLSIPPTIAQQALYLLGAVLAATAVSRLSGSAWAGRITIIVLALSPVMLGFPASRVYRDALVAALALLALALALQVVAFPRARRHAEIVRVAALAAAVGLVIGLLQITRADTQWVLLSVILVLACSLLPNRTAAVTAAPTPAAEDENRVAAWAGRNFRVLLMAGAVALVLLVSGIPSMTVAGINGARYGIAVVDLFSGGGLAQAWRAWVRVEPHSPDPLLPLSPERRAAVYAISPAAALLEPALTASPQAGYGSGYASLALAESGAAPARGSGGAYNALFTTVARDIATACADGRLQCSGRSVAATLPVLEQWDYPAIIRTAVRDMGRMWLDLDTAFPIGGCGERFARDGCFRAGILPGPIVDNGTEYPLWSRTISGLLPSGDLPDPRSWALRSQVALTSLFSTAWWILAVPALVGLLGGLAAPGTRQLGLTGCAIAVGAMASAGLIAVYSVHTGTSVTFHYFLGSVTFALLATVIGLISLMQLATSRRTGR